MKASQRACTQSKQEQDEPVRAYAARIRSLWREAEWDESNPAGLRILYDLAWEGLRPYLRERLKPLVPDDGYEALDELFDMAAKSEGTPPRQSGPRSIPTARMAHRPAPNNGDRKRRHQPSVDANSTPVGKPPAPWVERPEFDRRREQNLCLRCGGKNHKAEECWTYGPARPGPGSKRPKPTGAHGGNSKN